MPGISRPILDAVFYLYPSEKDALSGARSGATGFFTLVNSLLPGLPIDSGHRYAVTNAHVIEELCIFARINSPSGFKILPLTVDKWTFHPDGDDVAVCPLSFDGLPIYDDLGIRSSNIPEEMFITKQDIANELISPGDEAFFIGRYADHGGTFENTPTVRFGSISQVDGEPVPQDRQSGPGPRNQESILVEARSLSGYSGSPVLAYRGSRLGTIPNGKYKRLSVVPQVGLPLYLLGIDWGHHPWREPVRDKRTGKPLTSGDYVSGNSGMAMAVPAWRLMDVLMNPELIESREQNEQLWLKEIC
jgi:hypothetical protein